MTIPSEAAAAQPREPIRVALCGEYPVRESEIHGGGVQSVTHVLAQALARRDDVECHVVCATRVPPSSGPLDRTIGALRIHFVPRLPLPRLATCRAWDVPRLARQIRALRPAIVHGQGQDRHGLAAVRCGLPCVVTPHGVIFVESGLQRRGPLDLVGGWKKQMMDGNEREVFQRAHDMILISPYLRQAYGPLLTARVHPIDNPIDGSFFDLERAPVDGRLLFVGTVVPRKQVTLLVTALARLADAAHDVPFSYELRIVGPLFGDAYEAALRQAIAEAGLGAAVVLTGGVPHERLLEEYRTAEILLLASREETAPQVIAQAMACGLPAVSADVGGVSDMLEQGRCGAVYPAGDAEACARAIASIHDDPERRAVLSANAREAAVRRFHPDSVAAKTVAVYREVLGIG